MERLLRARPMSFILCAGLTVSMSYIAGCSKGNNDLERSVYTNSMSNGEAAQREGDQEREAGEVRNKQAISHAAREVLVRMTRHYASLTSATLTVKPSESSAANGKVRERAADSAIQCVFRSPDIYARDSEAPRRLPHLSGTEIDKYGQALEDVSAGYLMVIPQLFQGFQITETFPRVSRKSEALLNGEATDVIVLERDSRIPRNLGVSTRVLLTLWVSKPGQLKRYHLALQSTMSGPNFHSSTRGMHTVRTCPRSTTGFCPHSLRARTGKPTRPSRNSQPIKGLGGYRSTEKALCRLEDCRADPA